jgi:hypothetical protein
MSSIIKENEIPVVETLADADLIRTVLSTGESKEITLEDFKAVAIPDPSEVTLDLDGATTIDLALYNRNSSFKLTVTSDSTFVFSNMVAGQLGSVTIVDDGLSSYGWTVSYSGDYRGTEIVGHTGPSVNTYRFQMSSTGTADAVEPTFDTKSSALIPIAFNMNSGGALVTTTPGNFLFKVVNGWTYVYYGTKLNIVEMWATAEVADSGATQANIYPIIALKTLGGVDLSATDNTFAQGTIAGDVTSIGNGEYIDFWFTEGSNGTTENVTFILVCREF